MWASAMRPARDLLERVLPQVAWPIVRHRVGIDLRLFVAHQLSQVVLGEADDDLAAELRAVSAAQKLVVDEFADQGRGHPALAQPENLLLDRAGDLRRDGMLEARLLGERGDDALAPPRRHVPRSRPVDQEEIVGKQILRGRRRRAFDGLALLLPVDDVGARDRGVSGVEEDLLDELLDLLAGRRLALVVALEVHRDHAREIAADGPVVQPRSRAALAMASAIRSSYGATLPSRLWTDSIF
jgi:hypothetical protein